MAKHKNRNRNRKSEDKTAPSKDTVAQASSHEAAPHHSGPSIMDTNTHSFDGSSETPIVPSSEWQGVSQPVAPREKRDSVISTTWEGPKRDPKPEVMAAIRRRRRNDWLRSLWPSRTYRWVCDFITALTHIHWGPQKLRDLLLTLGLLAMTLYAFYLTSELVLGLVKGVSAQEMDANCSIVYVTIPGPIITVSLIGASPTNPAHGTYYYSVISGSTQWLNSVAPPSRFSTLMTQTPVVTPIISSQPGSGQPPPIVSPAPSTLPSTIPGLSPAPPSPAPLTSLTTIVQSGSTLITSIIMSVPSGNGLTLPTTLTSFGPPTPSTAGSSVPANQPQRPYPSPVILTSTMMTSVLLPSGLPPVGPPTVGITPSTLVPGSTGSLSGLIPVLPSTNVGSSLAIPSGGLSTPAEGTTVSIPITITSIVPGGSTAILTVTSTNIVGGSFPATSAAPSTAILITSTLPGGSTTTLTSMSTTSRSQGPFVSSFDPRGPLASTILVTVTSTLPGGQPTTIASIATTIISGASPGATSMSTSSITSSVLTPIISSLPGNSAGITTITPTNAISSPLPSLSTSSASSVPLLSSVVISITTTAANGQPTTIALTSPGTTSQTAASSSSPSPPIPSLSSPTITTVTPSGGFTVSLPNPSNGPNFSTLSSTPAASTIIITLISSGLTTTLLSTLPATGTPVLETLSSSLNPSTTGTSSSSTPSTSSTLSTASTMVASSIPSPSSVLSSSLLTTGPVASLSPILTPTASSSSGSSQASIASSIAGPSTPTVSNVPLTSSAISSQVLNSSGIIGSPTTTFVSVPSTLLFSSVISPTSTLLNTTLPVSSASAVPPALTSPPQLNFTSSSTVFQSSSLLPNPSSQTSNGGLLSGSTSIPVTAAPGVNTTTSAVPGSNSTLPFQIKALTTRVISYGDTAISFVFPTPDITTTVSYWTGTYPTVTGPLPSDLQTVPMTTRSTTQTPLSALPSFEVVSTRRPRLRTVVTTIFDDDNNEATSAVVKRQAAPATATIGGVFVANTSTAALPGPTSCGESGNFTLGFDDTVVGDDNSVLLVANGMTNPYHHLFYANGFTYIPDKWEPYPAVSQPNVAMFLPLVGRLLPGSPFAGTLLPGELGAGPRASVDAYWFNAYSGYFGCALNGITPCTLRISGYRYDTVLKQEVLVAEQNATIPACWGYINCRLTQIFFGEQFTALSGIQFNAYTYNLNIPEVHLMDDLQLEWYNNTCSAGILRIGNR